MAASTVRINARIAKKLHSKKIAIVKTFGFITREYLLCKNTKRILLVSRNSSYHGPSAHTGCYQNVGNKRNNQLLMEL